MRAAAPLSEAEREAVSTKISKMLQRENARIILLQRIPLLHKYYKL